MNRTKSMMRKIEDRCSLVLNVNLELPVCPGKDRTGWPGEEHACAHSLFSLLHRCSPLLKPQWQNSTGEKYTSCILHICAKYIFCVTLYCRYRVPCLSCFISTPAQCRNRCKQAQKCLALPQRCLAIKMPPEMQVGRWMDVRAASGSLDNYWVVGWFLSSACHPHFDEAPTMFSTRAASTTPYTSNPINFSLGYDKKHCQRPNYQQRCCLSLPNQRLKW